jgi:hypothetical protein
VVKFYLGCLDAPAFRTDGTGDLWSVPRLHTMQELRLVSSSASVDRGAAEYKVRRGAR